MPSSRGSSQPSDWSHVSLISCVGKRVLYHWRHLGRLAYLSSHGERSSWTASETAPSPRALHSKPQHPHPPLPRSQPPAALVAPAVSSLPADSTRGDGSPGPSACHRPPPHCLPAIRASLLNSAQLTPGVAVPGWWQDAGSLSGWTCLPAASLPPVFSYSTHVLFLCSLAPRPQPLFLCIMKSYSAPYIQASDPLGSCFVLFLKVSSVLCLLRVSNLSCCCNFFPACHVLSFPWTESLQA